MARRIIPNPVRYSQDFVDQNYMKYPDGTDRIIYLVNDDDEVLQVYNGNRRAKIQNNKKI